MSGERPASSPEWIRLSEATALLGVSPATLRRWADAGHVAAFTTPGGHRRFDRAAIMALLPCARSRGGTVLPRGGEALRASGLVLRDALHSLIEAGEAERTDARARALRSAEAYGSITGSIALPTRDAVKVFHGLSSPVLREVAATARSRGLDAAQTGQRLIFATESIGRLLEACVAGHDAAMSRAERSAR